MTNITDNIGSYRYRILALVFMATTINYFWAFVIAGLSYLTILGFVHLLMPKMTPLDINLNYIYQ